MFFILLHSIHRTFFVLFVKTPLRFVSHLSAGKLLPSHRAVLLYTLRQRLAILITLLTSLFVTLPALATAEGDATSTTATANTVLQDPQVAPTPASPFVYPDINLQGTPSTQNGNNTQQAQQTLSQAIPNALNNPDTLASQLQPTDNALSQANQQLLSRNALLQRDVNDLQTQVNVLIKERSGQLFMYGAFTVAVSILLGFFIGWIVFGRRDRW